MQARKELVRGRRRRSAIPASEALELLSDSYFFSRKNRAGSVNELVYGFAMFVT